MGTSGGSSVHVAYISRRDAVLEREEGAFFRNVPDHVLQTVGFGEMRESLSSWAWAREESERAERRRRGGSGQARSHYRCVLSFERDLPTPAIRRMALDWLAEVAPQAVVMGFVHRNTEHTHAHLWIDSRGADGRKLDFTPRQWRRLSEAWRGIYGREAALRERLGIQEEKREERGTPGACGRADPRVEERAAERTGPVRQEPEARACAQSRARAVREARRLREHLEEMGGRAREADRGRSQDR